MILHKICYRKYNEPNSKFILKKISIYLILFERSDDKLLDKILN